MEGEYTDAGTETVVDHEGVVRKQSRFITQYSRHKSRDLAPRMREMAI